MGVVLPMEDGVGVGDPHFSIWGEHQQASSLPFLKPTALKEGGEFLLLSKMARMELKNALRSYLHTFPLEFQHPWHQLGLPELFLK